MTEALIKKLETYATAVLKAEPLIGTIGFNGDDEVFGTVNEASDLAALVLDEVIPALKGN